SGRFRARAPPPEPRGLRRLASDAWGEPRHEDRHDRGSPSGRAGRDPGERADARGDPPHEGPLLLPVRGRRPTGLGRCGDRARGRGPRASGVLLRPFGRDRGLPPEGAPPGEPPRRAASPPTAWPRTLHCACAVVVNNELYAARIGTAQVFLVRRARLFLPGDEPGELAD